MPRCGTCTTKDRTCNFDEKPQKRGPKRDNTEEHSTRITKRRPRTRKAPSLKRVFSEQEQVYVTERDPFVKSDSKILNFKNYICYNCPCIDPNNAIKFVEYQDNQHSVALEDQDLVLGLSVQAWFYCRIADKRQIAIDSSRQCNDIIQRFLDGAFSYNIAASSLYMSQYALNDNDLPRTIFHLNVVENYIKHRHQEQKPNQSQLDSYKLRHIELMYQNCVSLLKNGIDLQQVLKRYIYASFVSSRLKNIYNEHNNAETQLPQYKFDEFKNSLRSIKHDLDNDTHRMFIFDHNAIDTITETIKRGTVTNVVGLTDIGNMRNNACMMLAQGAKMQYALSEVHKDTQADFDRWMREAANYVSSLCEMDCPS
ncbi:hypothetical protein AKO1_008683, partial [Acrasis kona]